MTVIDLLKEVRACGGTIWVAGDRLELEVPEGFPDVLLDSLRQHKGEVLTHLGRRTGLVDLPWPVGYGGLPAEEVARAEAQNDCLGVKGSVERRLNVMRWLSSHYRDLGDLEMAQEMRWAYLELRHADPSIRAICGLCEYQQS